MWYDDKGSLRGLKALGRHDGVIEALKDPEISDRLSQLIARESGIPIVFARILYRQLLVRLVGLVGTLVDNAVQARLDNVWYRLLSSIPGRSVTARVLRLIDLTLASALADAQAEKDLRASLLSRLPVSAPEDLSREGLEFAALAEILKLS